jgi:exopolysaccharide biosynthesis protein
VQLATYLVTELHARVAMNLDGGGSTTAYARGFGVLNEPSTDNGQGPVQRAVYDGIFVFGP